MKDELVQEPSRLMEATNCPKKYRCITCSNITLCEARYRALADLLVQSISVDVRLESFYPLISKKKYLKMAYQKTANQLFRKTTDRCPVNPTITNVACWH